MNVCDLICFLNSGHLNTCLRSPRKTEIMKGQSKLHRQLLYDGLWWWTWQHGEHTCIRWTWVRVSSGSWWWAGKPGVLQFMGSQWVGHDWATELNWTEFKISFLFPRESSPFNVISGWLMRSLSLLHFVWLPSQYLIKKNFQLSLFYSEYPQEPFDNDPVYSCLSCLLTQLEG